MDCVEGNGKLMPRWELEIRDGVMGYLFTPLLICESQYKTVATVDIKKEQVVKIEE